MPIAFWKTCLHSPQTKRLSFDLPDEIVVPYCTLVNYRSKPTNNLEAQAKTFCENVKGGRTTRIKKAIDWIVQEDAGQPIVDFVGDATLVPVPKSHPIQANTMWPSRIIAEHMVAAGLGREVSPIIKRTKAVPKSAFAKTKEDRPSIQTHSESLHVEILTEQPDTFVLVDDVITLGRTTMTCALKLLEAYPDAEVKVFCLIGTVHKNSPYPGFVLPKFSTLSYYYFENDYYGLDVTRRNT